jgi:predicted DNA-binding antitoxin AbrB/MazE fold protein
VIYRLKATYRDGVFVPERPVSLPQETEVQVTVETSVAIEAQQTSIREQLRELIQNMQRNHIPNDAPRFTREELHERG